MLDIAQMVIERRMDNHCGNRGKRWGRLSLGGNRGDGEEWHRSQGYSVHGDDIGAESVSTPTFLI